MKEFLAKYMPPLSTSQVEEIAQEHERLVAIEIEKLKYVAFVKKKGK